MDDLQTMFPVDYVFPYVNPNDPNWLNDYNAIFNDTKFFNQSFSDWGLLKYKLRSLAKNMTWISNVFIIVSSDTQLPTWLNTDNVYIVKHKDFIPKKFLPTFNSCTIEMFLPSLPTISNHIIYGNDDTFVMKPTSFDDFFTKEGKPKISYKVSNSDANFLKIPKRCTRLVEKTLNKESDNYFCIPQHYCVPMDLGYLNKFFNKVYFELAESITPKRDVTKNYSQYVYVLYQILSDNFEEIEPIGKLNDMLGISKKEVFQDILNPTEKLLCINDSDINDIELIENIQKTFEKVFPDKCKYEK